MLCVKSSIRASGSTFHQNVSPAGRAARPRGLGRGAARHGARAAPPPSRWSLPCPCWMAPFRALARTAAPITHRRDLPPDAARLGGPQRGMPQAFRVGNVGGDAAYGTCSRTNAPTEPAAGLMLDNLLPIPDAESLPFYPSVLKLVVCACSVTCAGQLARAGRPPRRAGRPGRRPACSAGADSSPGPRIQDALGPALFRPPSGRFHAGRDLTPPPPPTRARPWRGAPSQPLSTGGPTRTMGGSAAPWRAAFRTPRSRTRRPARGGRRRCAARPASCSPPPRTQCWPGRPPPPGPGDWGRGGAVVWVRGVLAVRPRAPPTLTFGLAAADGS